MANTTSTTPLIAPTSNVPLPEPALSKSPSLVNAGEVRATNVRPQVPKTKGPKPVAPRENPRAPGGRGKALRASSPKAANPPTVLPPVGGQPPQPEAALVPAVRKLGFVNGISEFKPTITRGSNTESYLKKLGFGFRYHEDDKGGECNPHACQAAERTLATAKALAYVYSKGVRSVLSVYGDPRDEAAVRFGNREEPDQPMYLQRYTPFLTAKDGSRKPTNDNFGDLAKDKESLLLVDVYETSIELPAPLGPKIIARMLEALPSPYGNMKLTWIGRKFYGDVGVVAGEGAWRRVAGNTEQILFRSSIKEAAEYQHDPCDWIWRGSSSPVTIFGSEAVLSWFPAHTVGSLFIICFNLTPGPMAGPNIPLYGFDKQLVSVETPNSYDHWSHDYVQYLPRFLQRSLVNSTTVLLHKPVFDKAYREIVNKRYTPTNFSLVSSKILLEAGFGDSKVLFDAFPDLHPQHHLSQLAWGVLLHGIVERETVTANAVLWASASMHNVNQLQGSIGAPPSPVPPLTINVRPLLYTIGVCLAFYGAYRVTRSSPARSIFNLARAGVSTIQYLGRAGLSMVGSSATAVAEALPITTFDERVANWVQTPVGNNYAITLVQRGFDVLVAPVWEEIAKRLLARVGLGWLLPTAEFGFSLVYGGPVDMPRLIGRSWVAYLHMRWLRQPLWRGILGHFAWNLFATVVKEIMANTDLETPSFLKFCMIMHDLKTNTYNFTGSLRGFLGCSSLCALTCLIYWLYRKRTTPVVDVYASWKYDNYIRPWTERVLDQTGITGCFKFSNPLTLESAEPSLQYTPEEDHLYAISGEPFPPYEVTPRYFFQLLPTNMPGYIPQPTYENAMVAVSSRLLRAPPMLPALQARAWRLAADLYGAWFVDNWIRVRNYDVYVPPWDQVVDNWVDHFDCSKKRKFYRNLVAGMRKSQPMYTRPTTTDVFVKHDELLLQCKSSDDGIFRHHMKPRIISNVAPVVQAWVGPYVMKIQKRFKKTFDPETPPQVCQINGEEVWFHLSTAGAGTDEDLTDWMNLVIEYHIVPAHKRGFCVIVSGDDSLCVEVKKDGTFVVWEGDASMFDSTQSTGPLRWQYRVMNYLGASVHLTAELDKISHNTYILRPKKNDYDIEIMRIHRTDRPTRDTGGADTYLGNTIVMMSAWYFVLRKLLESLLPLTMVSLTQAFSELGFAMKFRCGEFDTVTFLKGMWYKTHQHGYVWGPLPSRILKAGKALNSPTDYYPGVDMETAAGCYLRDVARSNAPYLQVPIFRAFVARYRTLTCPDNFMYSHKDVPKINPYAITGHDLYSELRLDDDAIVKVCERYGFTEQAVSEMESLIMASSPLSLLCHPGFIKMALVDYN